MAIRSETEVTVNAREEKLDDILFATQEPLKTWKLKKWMSDWSDKGMCMIKVADGSGKHFRATLRSGEVINIGPTGVMVGKPVALELLQRYGREGQYTGKNQETGFTRSGWIGASQVQREMLGNQEPEYLDRYLTHIPTAEHEAQLEAARAERESSSNSE